MGHCPQSNHHRSYRHSGSFRSGRLQIAMRTITLLIVHCSATPQGVALGFEDYGTGCLLLGAAEYYKLVKGKK